MNNAKILDLRSALWLCLAFIPPLASSSIDAKAAGNRELPGECQQATVSTKASTRDRVTVHHDGHGVVMEVDHVTGIGGARLTPPAAGWPADVAVRLHGFPDLENFSASVADMALKCERTRPPGTLPQLQCRLGDVDAKAIRQVEDYFEVTLPRELLANGGMPVEVRWIDQWR